MDIRDLFATVQITQRGQKNASGIPNADAPKKTSRASASIDHERGPKRKALKPKTSTCAAGKASSERSTSLIAGPVPYDGASNFMTLEELSRKRDEKCGHESDADIHEDAASESSAVESHPQGDDEDADDEPDNFECDDTRSVHSGASVRSAKSAGTRSAPSGSGGKDTTVKRKRKTPKSQSVALVYEEY